MMELVVALAATTGLFALAKGFKGNQRYEVNPSLVVTFREDKGDDLPCPWCYGPTHEDDKRCPGCGRTFG